MITTNTTPINYTSSLQALKAVALELELNQDVLDKLASFPSNADNLDDDKLKQLISIAKLIHSTCNERGEYHQGKVNEISDIARQTTQMFENLIIRKQTKPTSPILPS